MYQKHTTGGHFSDIRHTTTWRANQGAFIDDVTLFHKEGPRETVERLQKKASEDLQLWTNLLWTSGGEINFKPTKTYTRIMKWEFTNGGKPFLMPQQGYQPTITEPPNHTEIKVHSISPYTAKKSLGVWKSMDQSNESHLQALQIKHKHFHESFISHKTTPHGALHL